MSSSTDPTSAAYKAAVENLGLKPNIAKALEIPDRELQVEISEGVEIKIAPGMVADLYVAPEKTKTVTTGTKLENKGGFLSGIFGNKK